MEIKLENSAKEINYEHGEPLDISTVVLGIYEGEERKGYIQVKVVTK